MRATVFFVALFCLASCDDYDVDYNEVVTVEEYENYTYVQPDYDSAPFYQPKNIGTPADRCRLLIYDNETVFFGVEGCRNGGMGMGVGGWPGYKTVHAYPFCCQWDACIPDQSGKRLGGICYNPYRTMACCPNKTSDDSAGGISVKHCSTTSNNCLVSEFKACCGSEFCVVDFANCARQNQSCCSYY